MTDTKEIVVEITARDGDGALSTEEGYGLTTEAAVADAMRSLIANTEDTSYVMENWKVEA